MSLPLSPSTTYVAGTTPSIKAADLNDLQTYLAGAYVGTRTVKALTVDGTGGAAATPTAGTLNVGSNTKQIWLSASDFVSAVSGDWTVGIGTSHNGSFVAGGAGKNMVAMIPLPYQIGGSSATTTLVGVAIRVHQAGATPIVGTLVVTTGLGTTGGAVVSSANATASTSIGGVGEDVILIAAVGTVAGHPDKTVTVQVTSGQTGDIINGINLSLTASVF